MIPSLVTANTITPTAATNASPNRRDARLMLDALEEYQYSEVSMLEELRFNFGYDEEQASAVYKEWIRTVE